MEDRVAGYNGVGAHGLQESAQHEEVSLDEYAPGAHVQFKRGAIGLKALVS